MEEDMQGERSMVVLGLHLMEIFKTKKKKNCSKILSHTKFFLVGNIKRVCDCQR